MRIPFDFERFKNEPNLKVVDKDGNSVDVYPSRDGNGGCVVKDGMYYVLGDQEFDLFFEVDDPSEKKIRDYEVSDFAKNFQSFTNDVTKDAVVKCAEWFIELSGIFGHYGFFTHELWRKVEGFKNADKGEVICAFLCWWFRYKYGFNEYPCGCGWTCTSPRRYDSEDKCFEEYIKEWMPVIEAYYEWCGSRR